MSVTEGRIQGKNHQDTNVPRSNPAISQIRKNTERHTAHTTVSWPNPKQWVIVHTFDLMMITRQSIFILSISQRKLVNWYSPTYYIMDNWDNMPYLTHTLDKIYLTGVIELLTELLPETYVRHQSLHLSYSPRRSPGKQYTTKTR